MSRTQNAMRNFIAGMASKMITLMLGFISRTIFIRVLGNEYLGISGLYTEILSMLSFAELGFGSAMAYAMYEPVAKNEVTKLIKLVDYYKNIYRKVASFILVVGILLIPLLPYVINNTTNISTLELRIYYCFFLFNTVVNYFVVFKYSVVNAYQKNYIITNIDAIIQFVTVTIQIIALLVFRNFTVYLVVQSTILLFSRISISLLLNKLFPVLRERCEVTLSKEEKAPIVKNVKGLAVHQFSSLAVHSTDNIIISTCTSSGILAVGMVSNYMMLINSVLGIVTILFSSVVSGFGNMVVESSAEHYRKNFLLMNFVNFWIYGFSVIAFFILVPPFITLWIGQEYLIETSAFFLIILNCYMQGQCTIYNNVRIAKGDFSKDKWWGLLQAIVNLVVSIIFANQLGLVGVYIGTVVSRLVYVAVRPYSTYKFLFEKSSKEYYQLFFEYLLVVIIAGTITYVCTSHVLVTVTISNFIIGMMITAIIPNVIFFILYRKKQEFKDVISLVKNIRKVI